MININCKLDLSVQGEEQAGNLLNALIEEEASSIYNIANLGYQSYFVDQIASWKKKVKRFEKMPMVRDNAIKNAGLFEAVVDKIRLEKLKNE